MSEDLGRPKKRAKGSSHTDDDEKSSIAEPTTMSEDPDHPTEGAMGSFPPTEDDEEALKKLTPEELIRVLQESRKETQELKRAKKNSSFESLLSLKEGDLKLLRRGTDSTHKPSNHLPAQAKGVETFTIDGAPTSDDVKKCLTPSRLLLEFVDQENVESETQAFRSTSTPKSSSITFFHLFNKKPIDDQEALNCGYRAGKFIDTFRKKILKYYSDAGYTREEMKALRSRNKEEYDALLVSVADCQRMLNDSFVESGLDNNLESSPLAREVKQKLSDILAGNWGSDTDNNRIRECLLRGLVYASVFGQSPLHILDYYIKFCLPSSHRACIKFRPEVIRDLVFNRCETLPRPFNTNPLVSKFRALAAIVSNEGGGAKKRLKVSVDDHFRHLEFWRQLSLDCLGIYPSSERPV